MSSPASSSNWPSPVEEFLQPSATKKWKCLPSWEPYIKKIETVRRTENGEVFVYFKLKGEKTVCREISSMCVDKFLCKLLEFYESKCPLENFFEPSATDKWGSLSNWDQYIETIYTVKRIKGDYLDIYFKLKGEMTTCKEDSRVCADMFPNKLLEFYTAKLKW
ncbi:hypothetical protein BGY98DRAFT_1034958 [Russula aff. rugulosa BPL654]|nr:hypothetical protein BGY98DRAFT_1034958 [Russula aff. rugulosa BPL654]